MLEININNDKLIGLINKYTVEVAFNGIHGFSHKVINAKKLLDDIHETADCSKEIFIDLINTMNNPKTYLDREKYKPNSKIKALFTNIRFQGPYGIAGHEALGKDPYIELKKISEEFPELKEML